jgi:hypothetical protein
MTSYNARRHADRSLRWDLIADGYKFAELRWHQRQWMFRSSDDELQECVVHAVRGMALDRTSLRPILAKVKEVREWLAEDARKLAEAEQWAENAWLRAAEQGTWEDFEEEARERDREWFFGDASGAGQDWDVNGPRH